MLLLRNNCVIKDRICHATQNLIFHCTTNYSYK